MPFTEAYAEELRERIRNGEDITEIAEKENVHRNEIIKLFKKKPEDIIALLAIIDGTDDYSEPIQLAVSVSFIDGIMKVDYGRRKKALKLRPSDWSSIEYEDELMEKNTMMLREMYCYKLDEDLKIKFFTPKDYRLVSNYTINWILYSIAKKIKN